MLVKVIRGWLAVFVVAASVGAIIGVVAGAALVVARAIEAFAR